MSEKSTNALLTGYQRFRENRWPQERAEYESLASGQRPHTLVVACSDSRADPALIFDAAPGELALTGLHFGIADGVLRALTGPGRFEAL